MGQNLPRYDLMRKYLALLHRALQPHGHSRSGPKRTRRARNDGEFLEDVNLEKTKSAEA
jgi:hypothetical protein